MPNFQSGVNQLINLTAIAGGLWSRTPQGESVLKGRQLKSNEKKLTKALQSTYDTDDSAANQEIHEEVVRKLEENRSEQFYNNPTAKNLKKYSRNKAAIMSSNFNIFEANQNAGNIAAQQAEQKLTLNDRLKLFRESSPEERREFMRRAGQMQAINKNPQRYTKKEDEV